MTDRKIALVTGGSGGIGAACARVLAERGFRVAITYRSREEQALALAERLEARAYPLDLRDRSAIRHLARTVDAELGRVQVLVHSAGMIRDALLPFLSEADWDAVHDVNLKGPALLTKALIKGMLGSRWGRVVAIASASGVIGQMGQTHYSAAKGGLIAFIKALSRETARYGVTANAIAPGLIDTEILADVPEESIGAHLDRIPLQRLGTPEEVAGMVGYLTSEEGGYVTGQVLKIDGGLMMG